MFSGVVIAFGPLAVTVLVAAISGHPEYLYGLYLMFFTIPAGMVVAAIGGVILAVQKSRAARNTDVINAWAAPTAPTEATTSTEQPEIAVTPPVAAISTSAEAPTPAASSPTLDHAPADALVRSNMKTTSSMLLVLGVAIFASGIAFNATRSVDALNDTSSALTPIDVLWLGLLITSIAAAKVRVAFRLPGAPVRYSTAQALLWAGVFCIAWSPAVWIGMAVPTTAEFVNLALDPGGVAEWTAFGMFSGGGNGPFLSAFSGGVAGIALILWSSRVSRKVMQPPS